jgi:hypothetical protein
MVRENQTFFAVLHRKQWKLTSACLVVTCEKNIALRIKYPEQLVQFYTYLFHLSVTANPNKC